MSTEETTAQEKPRGSVRLRMWGRVLRLGYLRFGFSVATLMAAAVAFYSLLCLGPLGLLMAALLQAVFGQGGESYRWLQMVVRELGGQAAAQLMPQLNASLTNPSTYVASLIGLALLIWAGLQLFVVIERSLTEAWPGKLLRGYFGRKLVALSAMGAGGLLLCGVVLLNFMRITLEQRLRQIPGVAHTTVFFFVSPSLSFLIEFAASLVAFTLLYKFMPVPRIATRVAVAGGLFAAVAWHLVSPAFTYSLAWSARSQAMYGGLAQVMTFLLWAFLGARILIAGAHFAAAYEHVFYNHRPASDDEAFIERVWPNRKMKGEE
jgi:membrane protein